MKFLYIIIDHINGEFNDLEVIINDTVAINMLDEGYIVYKVNLDNLNVEELK